MQRFTSTNLGRKVDFENIATKMRKPQAVVTQEQQRVVDQQWTCCIVEKVVIVKCVVKERCDFLEQNALFLKWGGPVFEIEKVKEWCDKKWGEVKDFKTLENGFYMVTVDIAHDRNWILNSGPYFMDGYGSI